MFFDLSRVEIVDLSLPIENHAMEFPIRITYWTHAEGAKIHGKSIGVNPAEFPDGVCQAWEELTLITHAGTHLDSPWHFYPTTEDGRLPSKTVDQVPLDWCIGPGVRLDFRHKGRGENIAVADIEEALEKIGYELKPGDIPLIWTGVDKRWKELDYGELHPGVGREATLYLIERGCKVMGTDGLGWDMGFQEMGKAHRAGVRGALWPGHFVGKEREYCHIEKLANLEKLPKPYGFLFCAFPVKVERASAAWVRAVAFVERQGQG